MGKDERKITRVPACGYDQASEYSCKRPHLGQFAEDPLVTLVTLVRRSKHFTDKHTLSIYLYSWDYLIKALFVDFEDLHECFQN